MNFKIAFGIVTALNISVCCCMLPSYYSGNDTSKKKIVVSTVHDESILETGYQFYEEGMELQESGDNNSALSKYEAAFFGKEEDFQSILDPKYKEFEKHVNKGKSVDECFYDIIKKSIISSVASSIASIFMRQSEFLKAAFWYGIAYVNGNSSARNSFEEAITYYNSSK